MNYEEAEAAALSMNDLLARQRRFDEARRVLEQIIELRPRSVEARAALAALREQAALPARP